MSLIGRLQTLTGDSWTGIQFLDSAESYAGHTMSLCEAITLSFRQTVILSSSELSCAGARRSFGLNEDVDAMARKISDTTGMSIQKVLSILSGRPRLEKPPAALLLGDIEDSQIYVGYLKPESAMNLLRLWQSRFGLDLEVSLSTFVAICSCVAGALRQQKLFFSLGCPNSRKEAKIPSDVLIAVLPADLAAILQNID